MVADILSLLILSAMSIAFLFIFAIPVSLVVGGMFCANAFIEEFLLHHPDSHITVDEPTDLRAILEERARAIPLKHVA